MRRTGIILALLVGLGAVVGAGAWTAATLKAREAAIEARWETRWAALFEDRDGLHNLAARLQALDDRTVAIAYRVAQHEGFQVVAKQAFRDVASDVMMLDEETARIQEDLNALRRVVGSELRILHQRIDAVERTIKPAWCPTWLLGPERCTP